MRATQELAQAVDRAVLENLHEVQGLAGNIRYLNRLRIVYGPGANERRDSSRKSPHVQAGRLAVSDQSKPGAPSLPRGRTSQEAAAPEKQQPAKPPAGAAALAPHSVHMADGHIRRSLSPVPPSPHGAGERERPGDCCKARDVRPGHGDLCGDCFDIRCLLRARALESVAVGAWYIPQYLKIRVAAELVLTGDSQGMGHA